MHDRTRIVVCRWGFLALCVVPTLLTCGLIALHWLTFKSPAAKAEWERELSQRLGMAVTIESVSYPQPSVAELISVTLADAETGQPLADCSRVEIAPSANECEVRLVEPTIHRDSLAGLIERLHDRLLASRAPLPRLHLTAAQLTIESAAAADSLVNLTSEMHVSADRREWRIRFALPQQSEFVELHVTRNRQLSPPATQVAWNCPSPVPTRWLSEFIGDLNSLGKDATLAGRGQLTLARLNFSGEFSGELAGIDLATAISDRFPHVLSGRATLSLERAIIDGSRLTKASGTLVVAGGGRISRTLLTAAQEHLHLTTELPASRADSVQYDRLALSFELTSEFLRLKAESDESPSGAIMTSTAGPLLAVAADHEAPAVALARTLLPDSQVQVPAAAHTAALLDWLPMRSSERARTARRDAHTPTRLAPSQPARSSEPIRERSLR